MADEEMKRKLTAILSADVQDYSRLMGQDEVLTIRTLNTHRDVISDFVQQYRGRVVDSPGDNIMAAFGSVSNAVNCAVEIQRDLAERNAEVPSARMMQWRIGVNLGDLVEEDGQIFGDGVNITARIEKMAEPAGICISGTVYDQIQDRLGLEYESLGEHEVKNIAKPVRVYRVLSYPGAAAHRVVKAKGDATRRWHKVTLAVVAVAVLCVGSVLVWNYVGKPGQPSPEAAKPATAAAEKPSIAVLPFDNMSGDPDQEYFSDSLTDEIISRLSKNSGLFVISRNSTFTYKGKAIKAKQVGEELEVKTVLEGSVLKAGDRIRVTAQLIDAATDGHLWSETYERELEDIFAVQAEIAQHIAAALRVEYDEAELERVRHMPTESLSAYDAFWKGVEHFLRLTQRENAQAREYFEEALDLDPLYAAAHTRLGHAYWLDYVMGWNPDPQMVEQAYELAQRANTLDPSRAGHELLLARVYSLKGQFSQAISAAERALAVDPNYADSYLLMGEVLTNMGRPEEAIEMLKMAIRLNPKHIASYNTALAAAYRLSGSFEDAVAELEKAISLNPDWQVSYAELALTYKYQWITQESGDPEILNKALDAARKGVALDEDFLWAQGELGWILMWQKRFGEAISEAEKAIFIAPSNAQGYSQLSEILSHAGEADRAIELAERAIQLDDQAVWALSYAYRLTGRFEDSVNMTDQFLTPETDFFHSYWIHIWLAVLNSELGRTQEAKAHAAEVLRLVPNFSIDVWGQRVPYKNPELVEREMAALRRAGLK